MKNSKALFLLTFIIIFLFSNEINAQRRKKKQQPKPTPIQVEPSVIIKANYDADSLLHGAFEQYFGAQLQSKGQYEHGKRTGEWVFTPTDTVSYNGNYENGMRQGTWKYYYEQELISEMPYKNDSLHGIMKTYYPYQQPCLVVSYNMGLKDGLFLHYYENGNTLEVREYSAGIRSGMDIYLTEGADTVNHIQYKNGVPYNIIKSIEDPEDSYSVVFSGSLKNGTGSVILSSIDEGKTQVESHQNFLNGKLHGSSRFYNEGELYIQGQYESGFMVGHWEKHFLEKIIEADFSITDKKQTDSSFYINDFYTYGAEITEYIKPQYPQEGDVGLKRMLMKRAGYPSIAREFGWEGRIFFQFIIEPTGETSTYRAAKIILHSIDKTELMKEESEIALSKACIRAIKQLPLFQPGFINGEPIPVRMIMPFTFRLN